MIADASIMLKAMLLRSVVRTTDDVLADPAAEA
jgi:hypothetical protein